MDKEWIFLDKHTDEYNAGLHAFLNYALEHASFEGTIKCPCKRCHNGYNRLPAVVEQHLWVDGMDPKYVNIPWTEHGEHLPAVVDHNMAGPSSYQPDFNLSGPSSHQPDSDVQDMLHDAFGMYEGEDDLLEPAETTEGPSLPNGPTPDAQRFYQLLEKADAELYPGAGKKMFDFLIKLYQIKALNSWSDVSFTQLLELLKAYLPPGETLPASFYLTKKFIKSLGLTYQKIDACPNDCMLYWKEYASNTVCHVCGTSRYKENTSPTKKVPAKVLRYFPLGPRLQRLYMSRHTSEFMVWHSEKRPRDGVLRHPADSLAWEELDKIDNNFGSDGRNVRLGLASDGFNPFGMMSLSHSTWPVIVTVYNLPPWLCMKKSYMMLSLLIPGPKSPGNDIDVYLQPLIDELKILWIEGVPTYDAFKKEVFQMRAALLWTINDFPAYAMLSGYSTKGSKACPTCGEETDSFRLHHGKKEIYMGHRKWLPDNHIFRTWYNNFNGSTEHRKPPKPMTGLDCLRALSTLEFQFGKGKETSSSRKRKRVQNNDNTKYTGPWRKQSIFFQLPYWKDLLLRHNIDVMHVEKNVTESVIGTLLGIDGKNKDSLKARLDMVLMGVKHSLHPEARGDRTWLPPAKITLSKDEKTLMCKVLESVRVSDGFSSNIRRCVRVDERKLVGLKSHDCHIIMQYLLPVAIRRSLKPDITKTRQQLQDLCNFDGCTQSKDGVESKRTRIGRNADDPGIVPREGLPLFVGMGRSIEPGHEFTLTDLEWERAHTHVLINCPQIKQHLDDHVANTQRTKNRRTTLMEAERQANNTFSIYFQELIERRVQRKEFVDPDIRALAIGPDKKARRFNKYIMNGFRFFVKSIDAQSNTQNCGVFVKAGMSSYATAGDRRPRDGVKDYYGVLTDIIELDYHHGRKVLLFDCDWADNRVRNRAVKMDEYGFILVNFDHLLPKPDTLILASQSVQFFYVQDPTEPNWHTVIRTRPRDLFDMGTDIEPEPYDAQNLIVGINDDGIARTDMDGVLVNDVIE
ncbi:uncharacterized protein LOC112203009 [Rosa chinensis]|uniref:uncharacterized protein LOC112203009 n=1 Tax=Rosa chinensis TaxID=74649 RepID=UPI000D08DB28|nr:uncharacterized protein LOC112203009 [Rosa chinensis]